MGGVGTLFASTRARPRAAGRNLAPQKRGMFDRQGKNTDVISENDSLVYVARDSGDY
jgi:hypothetical protein